LSVGGEKRRPKSLLRELLLGRLEVLHALGYELVRPRLLRGTLRRGG